jgi:branched-chain amino acid transport system substrate-binding protein
VFAPLASRRYARFVPASRSRLVSIVALVLLAGAGCPKHTRALQGIPPVPTTGDADARQRFEELRSRFERNQENPTAELEKIVDEYPDDPIVPHALLFAGMSAVRSGEHEAALANLEKLEELAAGEDDLLLRGRLYRGIALNYLGRSPEALPLLRAADRIQLTDEGERAEWLAAMAEASAGTGRAVDAIFYYDAFYAVGRPAERAYAIERVGALVEALDDGAVRRAFDDLERRGGPAAALLGDRLANRLEADGDLRRADQIRRDIARARAAIGLTPEASPTDGGDPQRLGAVLPLTGRQNRAGDLSMRGLAIASGSFGGGGRGVEQDGVPRPFLLSVRDSGSTAGAAADAVDELTAEGAIGLVGPMDVDAVERAAERAARAGMPMVSLSPRPGRPGGASSRFVFHVVHSAEDRARALAGYATDHEIRTFAILRPDNSYGRAIGSAFRAEVERLGGEVVVEVSYPEDTTSFRSHVNKLRKPWQALFVPDQARRLGLVAPALAHGNLLSFPVEQRTGKRGPRRFLLLSTAEAVDDDYIRQAGRYSFGAVFAPGFYPDRRDPRIGPFVDAYYTAYGRLPTALEAYAHDGALAIRAAVERGARSRAEVAAALAQSSVDGLTGVLDFDSSRRRADRGLLYRVEKLPQSESHELRALR